MTDFFPKTISQWYSSHITTISLKRYQKVSTTTTPWNFKVQTLAQLKLQKTLVDWKFVWKLIRPRFRFLLYSAFFSFDLESQSLRFKKWISGVFGCWIRSIIIKLSQALLMFQTLRKWEKQEMNYPLLFACFMAHAVICSKGESFDIRISS